MLGEATSETEPRWSLKLLPACTYKKMLANKPWSLKIWLKQNHKLSKVWWFRSAFLGYMPKILNELGKHGREFSFKKLKFHETSAWLKWLDWTILVTQRRTPPVHQSTNLARLTTFSIITLTRDESTANQAGLYRAASSQANHSLLPWLAQSPNQLNACTKAPLHWRG